MSQEHPSRVAATRSYDLRFLLSDKGASGTTQTRLRQTSGRRTRSLPHACDHLFCFIIISFSFIIISPLIPS